MSRAMQLENEVSEFRGEMTAAQAGRILRALDSFARYERRRDFITRATSAGPIPPTAAERREMQAFRREARLWQRRIVESRAFARVYEAFPLRTRLTRARGLLRSLAVIWGMVKDHHAGRLQPSMHLFSNDHAANLTALHEVALRFPDLPREWILETAERIELYLSRSRLLGQTARDEIAPPELIGTRGRAGADDAGAFRGWLVRSVAGILPDQTEERDAAIAEFLRLCGLNLKLKPANVRSILFAWPRKRR